VSGDFDDYWRMQRQIDEHWATPGWVSSAILNVARMGWFSSDRTIREYAEDIWGLPALNFEAPTTG
jgi:glycogen phosphorylase